MLVSGTKTTHYLFGENLKLNPCFIPFPKINPKCIKDLNIKGI